MLKIKQMIEFSCICYQEPWLQRCVCITTYIIMDAIWVFNVLNNVKSSLPFPFLWERHADRLYLTHPTKDSNSTPTEHKPTHKQAHHSTREWEWDGQWGCIAVRWTVTMRKSSLQPTRHVQCTVTAMWLMKLVSWVWTRRIDKNTLIETSKQRLHWVSMLECTINPRVWWWWYEVRA